MKQIKDIEVAAGSIIVKKETQPDGSTQLFTFVPSYHEVNFQLMDDETKMSPLLKPISIAVPDCGGLLHSWRSWRMQASTDTLKVLDSISDLHV